MASTPLCTPLLKHRDGFHPAHSSPAHVRPVQPLAAPGRAPGTSLWSTGSHGSSRRAGRCSTVAASALPPAASTSGSSSPTASTALQQEPQQEPQQRTSLLEWLVRTQGATPACLKVERRYAGSNLGWCLVATADIEPEEVILSVPLTAAITSEGVDESRWSTHMAAQLLDRQLAAAAAAASGDPMAVAGSVQPWLDVLPAHVDLPWLYWSDAELAELQDEDTIAEAGQFREAYEAAVQELGGAHSPQAVAWALSQVHSRSFVMQNAHVWCPGIDLCNHTLTPSADIRCIQSPGSCQGAAALDDVCPPETAAVQRQEPSRLELVAGEAGVGAGQEVTISYGSWPSDVFLLFFGFAPQDNPNDSAVLFYDLFDLASFKLRSVAGKEQEEEEERDEEAAAAEAEAAVAALEAELGPPEQYFRMVATANGLDSQLIHAAQALLAAGRGSPDGRTPLSLKEFLALRCRQLLGSFPTTLEEDEALLRHLQQRQAQQAQQVQQGQQQGQQAQQAAAMTALGEVRLEQLATAVTYRAGKKRVLHATLAAVQEQRRQ